MREFALIVVTLGACLDGPYGRTCRGFLCVQGGTQAPGRLPRLMRWSQQMRSWPKKQQLSDVVPSATQYTTLTGESGPEPMVWPAQATSGLTDGRRLGPRAYCSRQRWPDFGRTMALDAAAYCASVTSVPAGACHER